jgi:predicted aldo/keto reductase-like oxidoreductase
MSVFDGYFPIGLGTSRLPISGPDDMAGIDKSIALVCRALDYGVNYIDTSHIYGGGMAQTVLKHAFAQTRKMYGVTLKVQYGVDRTADDALGRVESSLISMGIDRAKFFVAWSVKSYNEFEEITKRGGIYEAAQKLKDEKVIEHICVSVHTPVNDTIRIINSGAFEGITISYSILNALAMQPILDAAQANKVGVAIMNPLGGGIIAKNKDFFSYLCNNNENNHIQAALRYIKAHSEVQVIISGCASDVELTENITAFTSKDTEPKKERIVRVNQSVTELRNFCTGCRYCEGCPKGVPIAEIMQSRNTLLFEPIADYNRTEYNILKNIALFRKMYFDYQREMDQIEYGCARCGQCEKKCIQRLNICDAVTDTYERAKATAYTKEAAKERLSLLLGDKKYKKIGFYPSGGYADYVLRLWREFFGEPDWEILMFNGNPKMRGTMSGGFKVHSPNDITALAPDIILVNSYAYRDAIYQELQKYEICGVKILCLHKDGDIPWVW